MKLFNPTSQHPARAVQAWQILVGKAMNRQTTTYLELSHLMYAGRDAQGVLAQILGHIAYYCIDNELPPLTSIVVIKGGGTPGEGIPVDPSQIVAQREAAFEFDWHNVYPPFENDLKSAYDRHEKKTS